MGGAAGTSKPTQSNGKNSREPAPLQPLADNLGALVGAAVALALFTVASAWPGAWWAAILAPLPILATAPELPARRARAIPFIVYLIGNLLAWPAELGSAPVVLVAGAHIASAAWFTIAVLLAADATRRWAGWLAALVYPTLITLFWFALAQMSPYGTWGNPAYNVAFAPLIQLVALTGLPGVTFVVAFVPAALAVAYYRRRWGLSWEPLALAPVALFLLVTAGGAVRLLFGGRAAPVAIGVGATDQASALSQAAQLKDVAAAVTLFQPIVHQLAARGAQVVVLPEKIVGVTPADQAQIEAIFAGVARAEHVWLVAGLNEIGRTPMVNRAAVFSPDGVLVASYAKREPLAGIEDGYEPGAAPEVFDAPWGRTAIMIGSDTDFAALGRENAAAGAVLALVPAWDLPGTDAMHARMASVRAIEAGFSIARAARQGEAALYNSRGQTVAQASTFSADPALAVADLSPGPGATFYARHGDWFGWLVVLAAIVMGTRFAVGALIDRRRTGGTIEWRNIEVGPAGAPAPRASAPAAENSEQGNEVLHYRR